ncbi:MAG: hypothetical protein JSC161_000355 [Candidatus Tokpelaia sp. JSC161]|jgi:hypothetical protein|nr:MAG: hypothetical protein JSC161_000355 [Candidatus Tokpelaia sp. JSC161]
MPLTNGSEQNIAFSYGKDYSCGMDAHGKAALTKSCVRIGSFGGLFYCKVGIG